MKVYELIERMLSDGTWLCWCSVSDDAMVKNEQYALFKLVCEREPERKYGYRTRIVDYVSTNGLKFAGGGVLRLLTRIRLNLLFVLWSAMCLCSCGEESAREQAKEMICGVPVEGTAWQLTANIADYGDGSFIPYCVWQIFTDKTYVDGRLCLGDGTELKAELIIETDEHTGQSIHATIHCAGD